MIPVSEFCRNLTLYMLNCLFPSYQNCVQSIISRMDPIRAQWVNSLAPGIFEWNFRHVIFKQNLVIDGWHIWCEIDLIWMSLNFTDDESTLVQVMAWCHQATSHYLSQCWPRSLSPYGVTRPQWVNTMTLVRCGSNFESLIFKLISQIYILSTTCKIAIRHWAIN